MPSRLWERIALGLLAIGMALIAYMWTAAQADQEKTRDAAALLSVRVAVSEAELAGCKMRLDRIDAKLDRILERLPK
jgi:uncharacterized membrane protein YidH (DUF202 family)